MKVGDILFATQNGSANCKQKVQDVEQASRVKYNQLDDAVMGIGGQIRKIKNVNNHPTFLYFEVTIRYSC